LIALAELISGITFSHDIFSNGFKLILPMVFVLPALIFIKKGLQALTLRQDFIADDQPQ
jgi:hypothetical protein